MRRVPYCDVKEPTRMRPTATEIESLHGGRVARVEVGGAGKVQLVHRHGTMEDVLERKDDM